MLSFKLPTLNLQQDAIPAGGAAFCFTVAGACASLESFCYGGAGDAAATRCRYAFFGLDSETCCPTGDAALPPRAP